MEVGREQGGEAGMNLKKYRTESVRLDDAWNEPDGVAGSFSRSSIRNPPTPKGH